MPGCAGSVLLRVRISRTYTGFMDQANLKKWLLQAERTFGEKIDGIVVGKKECARIPATHHSVVLPRALGLKVLDQTFNDFHGASAVEPFYAWTRHRVFFLDSSEGCVTLKWVPRHPVREVEPIMGGTFFR